MLLDIFHNVILPYVSAEQRTMKIFQILSSITGKLALMQRIKCKSGVNFKRGMLSVQHQLELNE